MKAVKPRDRRKPSVSSSTSSVGNAARQVFTRPRPPPVSPPMTIELRGVPIHFPFEPYHCQRDYMEKVLDALFRSENALLESPTGTGKTLCLLCATLAWQREEARKIHMDPQYLKPGMPRRVPTIIYASRTHSQLSQVVRELRNTRYRPKHSVLGSREQMCVNPKVKRKGTLASDINHDCSKLGLERKCQFRNKLENFTPPYDEAPSVQSVKDMEELVEMGQQHRVCPFYYTRGLLEDAELILLPYNYLFDKDSRTTTLKEVPWKNAVVIFDEAHNLESFASESASFDLSTTDIAGCLKELQRALNLQQTVGEDASSTIRAENLAKVKKIFLSLEEYIISNLPSHAVSYRGEYMIELFQKACNINHKNHQLFVEEVRKVGDLFMQYTSKTSKGTPRLDHFCQCLKRIFGENSEARCFAKAQSYRVHISQKQLVVPLDGNKLNKRKEKVPGRTLSYWCFAPSEAIRELANLEVRSILVTSGTLSPLESYALELDLPFPHRLENPHIIPDDQIHVRVIGKGVSNKVLSSSYERRQNDEYYTELGNTLISLGKVIPAGMLIFFPSYGVMEKCLDMWGGPGSSCQSDNPAHFFSKRKKELTGSARYSFPYSPNTFSSTNETMTPWKRLLGVKAVVVEPKSTADLPDAINEFHKYLNLHNSRGVALLGVCRGKISEGIDFSHDMCRAVVITGLPFAPSFDPKVKMKREFLDQNRAAQSLKASTEGGFSSDQASKSLCLSGHEWYTQQAHRAVNQAVGRVIRNKNDYGAVLLLDNRFSLPANQNGLSKWVRNHVLPDEGVGRAISALSKFYKAAAQKAENRDSRFRVATPSTNPLSVILQYEEEGKENNSALDATLERQVQTIAYVEGESSGSNKDAPNSNSGNVELLTNSCYIRPENIIERVGVDNKNRQEISDVSSSKLPHNPSIVPKRPEMTPVDRPSSAPAPDSASPAQRFFRIVQQKMTAEDISNVKHAAVAMKPIEGRYGPKFNNAARDMIALIFKYDDFADRSREKAPEMFMLFLKLVPKSKVGSTQMLAANVLFNESKLGKRMRDSLQRVDFVKIRRELSILLHDAWFCQSGGQYVQPQEFLARFETCLSLVCNAEFTMPNEELDDFLMLVPEELRGLSYSLLEQMKASERIRRIKAKEKAAVGEKCINTARFRPAVEKQEIATEASTVVNDEDVRSQGSLAKRPNPYTKQAASDGRSSKTPKTDELKHTAHSISHKTPGSVSAGNPQNPIRRFLNDLESDVFAGESKIAIKTITSNAPANFNCQICENPLEKPIMAQCNHVACAECWAQWLVKQRTCPQCREPTDWDRLAIVVFKSTQASMTTEK